MSERRDPNRRPLTEEQLAFFTAQTEHAVNKTVRHVVRRATVGFLILASGLGLALHQNAQEQGHRRAAGVEARQAVVHSGRAVAVDGCNRDFRTISSLRGILASSISIQRRAHERGQISDAQYKLGKKFYVKQLARLRLPDCRLAEHLLTDSPSVPLPDIVPLYPKKKKDSS